MNATATRDRFWFATIAIMSAAAIAAVAFVLTGPRLASGLDVSALPAVNTAWNAAAAVLLVAALIAIRPPGPCRCTARWWFARSRHRPCSWPAISCTTHSVTGRIRYGGPVPWLYYAILISHIILAVTIVPLALVTLRLGWTFHPRHRAVARVTFPIWLYVSVTGVVIFVFLYWLDA